MKIIDFERKGNLVRFYLGDDDLVEWYGDDWNDTPYEHNAERVYDEYIKGYCDMMFPFDDLVLEPCCGTWVLEAAYERGVGIYGGRYTDDLHIWTVDAVDVRD